MAQLWSMVTLAGIWGLVASTVGFIVTAFPARGVFAGRPALRWGGALLFCFVVWMVGMSRA